MKPLLEDSSFSWNSDWVVIKMYRVWLVLQCFLLFYPRIRRKNFSFSQKTCVCFLVFGRLTLCLLFYEIGMIGFKKKRTWTLLVWNAHVCVCFHLRAKIVRLNPRLKINMGKMAKNCMRGSIFDFSIFDFWDIFM